MCSNMYDGTLNEMMSYLQGYGEKDQYTRVQPRARKGARHLQRRLQGWFSRRRGIQPVQGLPRPVGFILSLMC